MGRSLSEMGNCLVIGHRGSPVSARENTLEAFRHAIDVGADGVELDVRRTADRYLVVHHDPEFVEPATPRSDPTTTESGVHDAERGFAGGRRSDDQAVAAPDGAGGRVIAATSRRDLPTWMPNLSDALAMIDGAAGPAGVRPFVNVEIKNGRDEPDFDPSRDVAVAVAELLARTRLDLRLLVSSFDGEAVDAVRDWADTRGVPLPTGRLGLEFAVADLDAIAAKGHSSIHPWWPTVTDELVAAAQDAGLDVIVWTCDEPSAQDRLRAIGVAGVITNDPGALVRRWSGGSWQP